ATAPLAARLEPRLARAFLRGDRHVRRFLIGARKEGSRPRRGARNVVRAPHRSRKPRSNRVARRLLGVDACANSSSFFPSSPSPRSRPPARTPPAILLLHSLAPRTRAMGLRPLPPPRKTA